LRILTHSRANDEVSAARSGKIARHIEVGKDRFRMIGNRSITMRINGDRNGIVRFARARESICCRGSSATASARMSIIPVITVSTCSPQPVS
jgi:hypothetical protein